MSERRSRTTRQEVLRLTRVGLTARQIAGVLGISTQAVYQHLAKLRAEGALEEGREDER